MNSPIRLGRGPLSTLRWHTRIVLWAFAAVAGLAVVIFAKLAEGALSLFFSIYALSPWIPLLLSPLVAMLTVWATRRYFQGSQGSGIPQVIAAIDAAKHGRPVTALVSLRIAFGKILLGAFSLVGGFSAGREGPSVQVAASILHAAHRFLPHSRAIRASDLIVAGGAAGVAAAFNTPLAGIVFAVEELGRRLETRTSGVLISTIIISGLMAIALLGNYNYFGHLSAPEIHFNIVVPVIFCGLLCGALGGGFSYMLQWPQRFSEHLVWRFRANNPIGFAGLCGLAVAAIGIASQGTSFGSGYAITAEAVNGAIQLPWYAPIGRFIATLITYFSGIPGGIFAPALAVGAAVGSNVSSLFASELGQVPLITLCMAGFLAAVTQAPITAAIIVMEMVDGHGMVLSLMAVALIAKAVSSRFSPALYEQLSMSFRSSASGRPVA